MKIFKIITIILSVISLLLLSHFLWWHWQLGITRYFDVDEFAYLHWAYQIFVGQKPYLDFFLYVPPVYQWFLAPVFFLGKGVAPFIAGRILTFVIFVCLAGAEIYLFWLVRRSWLAIFAGAVLAFLPLPFDKFLEIRPDNLSALLVIIGVIGEIRWLREKKGKYGFLAGVFYAVSLIVLPKSLPSILVAFSIGLAFVLSQKIKMRRSSLMALAGFISPLVVFGIWLLMLGNLHLALYSLIKLPFEVNKISQFFYMAPDLFFYPNQIFYGEGGWSQGLLVNAIIWIIAILVGTVRLFTPALASHKTDKSSVWEELLIEGIFIVQVIYYVMWSPLKHAQYLIPIAFFIAFYTADLVCLIWQKVKGHRGRALSFTVAFGLMGIYLMQTNQLVEMPKLAMTNGSEFAAVKKIFAKIPTSEYLLDLDGRTLYYPSPYYVCCLPFGQYAQFLSQPLPFLSEALERTKTKYIWQGELNRVTTLTAADQQYIAAHYERSKEFEGLLVRTE